MYVESDDTNFRLHKSPSAANNTSMLSNSSKLKLGGYHEGNRYCTQNRRFRTGGHPERNTQNDALERRRPLTENIDTRSGVLHGFGIGEGTVHRAINLKKLPAGSFSCYYSLFYSSSETASHHSVLPSSPSISIARCENHESGAAPCQCLTFAGIFTISPG